MQSTRLTYLIKQYNSGALSPAEWNELAAIMDTRDNEDITGELTASVHYISEASGAIDERLKSMADYILTLDKTKAAIIVHRVQKSSGTSRHPLFQTGNLKTAWFRYAAAILLILTGFFIYYNFSHTSQSENQVVNNTPPMVPDIMPGSDRAVLTLSDGTKIELNNATSDTIKDGKLSIENNAGQLVYKNTSVTVMNTMTTPKGGQYQLTLADGSKVWLNAASSITFPTAFKSSTREVFISGEAYFEVAKNKDKPFLVITRNERIQVLGTSFNVNAYDDEATIKTSLLEGSVKINNTVLQPGQAFVNNKIIATDIEQDIAWKNGFFNFNGADIQTVMRQISRWYNVVVKYEGKVPGIILKGEMDRGLSLSEILEFLNKIGIKYRINGNTIIVMH